MHSLHALTTCTRYMHSLHALATCTRYMPSLHALATCTRYMHSLHALATCTRYMHSLHALATCTRYMHSLHALATCTRHMHSLHALTRSKQRSKTSFSACSLLVDSTSTTLFITSSSQKIKVEFFGGCTWPVPLTGDAPDKTCIGNNFGIRQYFSTKFCVSIYWISCHRFPVSNFNYEQNDVISATFYVQISTQNAEKRKIVMPQILMNWIAFGP